MRCQCEFGDIVDPDEKLLWDTLDLVGTAAPTKRARDLAKNAKWVVTEGLERLRAHIVILQRAIQGWKSPRGLRVRAILREYAKPPRGM